MVEAGNFVFGTGIDSSDMGHDSGHLVHANTLRALHNRRQRQLTVTQQAMETADCVTQQAMETADCVTKQVVETTDCITQQAMETTDCVTQRAMETTDCYATGDGDN